MKFFVLETYEFNTNDFEAAAYEATGENIHSEDLKKLFHECPRSVKEDAFDNGSSDTVFREKFYEWLLLEKSEGRTWQQILGRK